MEKIIIIDNEVHRPTGHWTKQIHKLLHYLREQGFYFAPNPLGFDEQGREIVSFVKGKTGDYPLSEEIKSTNALVLCQC